MSKAIEVITSVERRRRWSAAEKERLVAASLERQVRRWLVGHRAPGKTACDKSRPALAAWFGALRSRDLETKSL